MNIIKKIKIKLPGHTEGENFYISEVFGNRETLVIDLKALTGGVLLITDLSNDYMVSYGPSMWMSFEQTIIKQ